MSAIKTKLRRFLPVMLLLASQVNAGGPRGLKLEPHHIALANGKSFDLNLPEGFGISVAAQGLKRVRFMAKSPDGRIFVTDMYNLTDNSKGVVYILDEFNWSSETFQKVTPYLQGLRNPNSIAFYRDRNGVDWFYLALTDHLLRYKYIAGREHTEREAGSARYFPGLWLELQIRRLAPDAHHRGRR